MNLLQRITVEEGKCGGRPCIRGKRIRVTDILDLLSHGASYEEILEDYSFLERDDILAAIAYASRQTDRVKRVRRWKTNLVKKEELLVLKAGEGAPSVTAKIVKQLENGPL